LVSLKCLCNFFTVSCMVSLCLSFFLSFVSISLVSDSSLLGVCPLHSLPRSLVPLLWPPCLSQPLPASPSSLSFCLYLPPHWPGPLFLSLCPPCGLLRVTPAPCLAGRPTSLAVLGRPGNSSRFLEKTTGPRERPSVSPSTRPLPRAWGSRSGVGGPRQEALRFLASPWRPPDLAPAPRPTAQILFCRSRWRQEEAQAERGFQGRQAWGFLSPGSGLRPPQWGPQVAGGAGCCCRVLRGGWGHPSGCLVATSSARRGQV
jgi:hypothetical protein